MLTWSQTLMNIFLPLCCLVLMTKRGVGVTFNGTSTGDGGGAVSAAAAAAELWWCSDGLEDAPVPDPARGTAFIFGAMKAEAGPPAGTNELEDRVRLTINGANNKSSCRITYTGSWPQKH